MTKVILPDSITENKQNPKEKRLVEEQICGKKKNMWEKNKLPRKKVILVEEQICGK
jgi:hypothetical protein